MEMEARFITSRRDKPDVVELDTNGVANAIAFLSYIRRKNRVEFMPDRDNVDVFEKFILQKASGSTTGLEVQLFEMTGQNLQDYYETKNLTFRKVT